MLYNSVYYLFVCMCARVYVDCCLSNALVIMTACVCARRLVFTEHVHFYQLERGQQPWCLLSSLCFPLWLALLSALLFTNVTWFGGFPWHLLIWKSAGCHRFAAVQLPHHYQQTQLQTSKADPTDNKHADPVSDNESSTWQHPGSALDNRIQTLTAIPTPNNSHMCT